MVVLCCDGTLINIDSKQIDYAGGDELYIGDETIQFQELERIWSDMDAYTDWVVKELTLAQAVLLKLKDDGATGCELEAVESLVDDLMKHYRWCLTA